MASLLQRGRALLPPATITMPGVTALCQSRAVPLGSPLAAMFLPRTCSSSLSTCSSGLFQTPTQLRSHLGSQPSLVVEPIISCGSVRGIKTKSSAKKRFKVLGNGRIKRWQCNKRHINAKRNRKHIRRLGDSKMLKGYQVKYAKALLGGLK